MSYASSKSGESLKEMKMYKVIDIQTKAVIRSYAADKARAARAYANKLDLKYGAVRYIVKWEA
jgi:hypothetical protein